MKRFLSLALAVASVGFIAVGTASADTMDDGDAANGIGPSRHNLGSMGVHVITNGTTEICVFCHTPHHTNTSGGTGGSLQPLWNRNNSGTYTAYGVTKAGTTINDADIGSTTLACLSCHDGVTTFDNLVNKPGKGTGAPNWSFYEDGGLVSDFLTSSRLKIGQNLSDDHPVSVVYDSGVAGLRDTTTVIADIDLSGDLQSSAGTYDGGNLTKNLWAVKGYVKASATIGDLLRGDSKDRVECSSCHDPHFNNKTWDEIEYTYNSTDAPTADDESNGLFLRRVGGNTGSGLCRTCHNK